MNRGRKIKYSGEELAVAISQSLGALSDSKYIAVITGPAYVTIRIVYKTERL